MSDSDEVDELLRADDVYMHYPVRGAGLRTRLRLRAVDGVSVSLQSGQTLAIVGESGCGKSTLGRLVAGLETPTAGHLHFEGRAVAEMSRVERTRYRRSVQVVFQDPFSSLDPRMTALRTVMEAMRVTRSGRDRAALRDASMSLLERVGLSAAYADRLPHQFSGGQRQRIGIARAVAAAPAVIVCDEPVSALDVSVQAQILNLLQDLKRELGIAYLFVSHDIGVVQHMSDRVAVMYLGRIVEEGPQESILHAPRHPYTKALLSALPVVDASERAGRQRIRLTGELPSAVTPPSGCRFRTRCWKAQDVCATADPQLMRGVGGHAVACHFPESVAATSGPRLA